MAGYWSRFLFCMFMDQDGVKVNKVTQKKNEANIQPS